MARSAPRRIGDREPKPPAGDLEPNLYCGSGVPVCFGIIKQSLCERLESRRLLRHLGSVSPRVNGQLDEKSTLPQVRDDLPEAFARERARDRWRVQHRRNPAQGAISDPFDQLEGGASLGRVLNLERRARQRRNQGRRRPYLVINTNQRTVEVGRGAPETGRAHPRAELAPARFRPPPTFAQKKRSRPWPPLPRC